MLRLRIRRGLTILEITVVLSIIGAMCAMAASVFPGPMQYYRARRSMESLLWDLRKIQQLARSRGHSSNGAGPSQDPAVFGIRLYQGTVIFDGATLVKDQSGYSYLSYSPPYLTPVATDLSALTAAEKARVVNLDLSLIPVRVSGVGATLAPLGMPQTIQFAQDVTTGLGDMVPDAASPIGACAVGCPNFMDFQLQNDDGYFRLEIDNQRFIGLRYVSL